MQLGIRHISISGKLLILIVVILAVIAAGLLGWFFYQKSHTLPVYHNSKYNYSLSYPRNWVIDASNAEKDFNQGVGGELVISNYENGAAQLESKNPPADLVTVKVDVYKISASTTLGGIVRSKADSLLRAKTNFLIQPVSLAGIDGKQFIYNGSSTEDSIVTVKTVLKKDTNMFVFTCNYLRQDSSYKNRYKLPEAVASAQNAILNSFKIK